MKKSIMFSKMMISFSIVLMCYFGNAQEIVWTKSLSANTNGTDNFKSNLVAKDNSDNLFVAGSFKNALSIGGTNLSNAGGSDIYLAKYDSNGNVVWSKSFGGDNNDLVNAITTDATGNIYLAGSFKSTTLAFDPTNSLNGNATSLFVVKFDSSGTVVWAKGSTTKTSFDEATALAVDASGNVFVGGNYSNGYLSFGSFNFPNQKVNPDFFITKLDNSGNLQWFKGFGKEFDDKLNGLAVDNLGNLIAVGYFDSPTIVFNTSSSLTNSGTSSGDLFIIKLNTAGDIQWARNATGSNLDQAFAVTTDSANNIYVAGAFKSSSLSINGKTINNPNSSTYITSFVLSLDSTGTATNWINQVDANFLYAININENSKTVYTSGTLKSIPNYKNVIYGLEYTTSAATNNLLSQNTNTLESASKSIVVDNQDQVIVATNSSTQQSISKILKTQSFCFAISPPTVDSLSNEFTWYELPTGDNMLSSTAPLSPEQIVYGQFNNPNKRNKLKILGGSCTTSGPSGQVYVYRDLDGDGYRTNLDNFQLAGSIIILESAATPIPSGYLTAAAQIDCDDNNNLIYKSYKIGADTDGDGYVPNTINICSNDNYTPPPGFIFFQNNPLDCNDNNTSINPGVSEIYFNNIDEDCNGFIDDSKITTTSILALTNTIYCRKVSASQGYRFEITNSSGGKWIIDKTIAGVKLSDCNASNFVGTSGNSSPLLLYNSSFGARVALRKNGIWQVFGPSQSIYAPQAPLTKIKNSQCGKNFSSTASSISVDTVSGAEYYTLYIDTETELLTKDIFTNTFLLSSLPNSSTKSFNIRVSFWQYGVEFGPFSSCSLNIIPVAIASPTPILTSSFVTTKMKDGVCGSTLVSVAQGIYADKVAGATLYRFLINGNQVIETPNRFFQLTSLPGGVQLGTTYSVAVACLLNGVWSAYSSLPCNITTPNPSSRIAFSEDNFIFNVISYPNPFKEEFKLHFEGFSDENVFINIYDMLGKQIENLIVKPSEVENITLGQKYSNGIYNVLISQGINTKTVRLLKN